MPEVSTPISLVRLGASAYRPNCIAAGQSNGSPPAASPTRVDRQAGNKLNANEKQVIYGAIVGGFVSLAG